jgi:DNA-binding transcriptional ArsR family regulator
VQSTDVYRAVADPTRRRVLERLAAGPLGFQDLHGEFEMTKGGLSQHLRVLRQAGLVAVDESDRSHRYRLTAEPLREVADWVLAYASFWDDKLSALDRLLEQQAHDRPTSGGS